MSPRRTGSTEIAMGGGTDAARAEPLAVGRGPQAATSSMVRPLPTTAIHRLNVNRVGSHQLARPISRMLAGTSTSRTRVVSSSTPIARPMPSFLRNCFVFIREGAQN